MTDGRRQPVLLVPALVAAYPAAFLWSANAYEIQGRDGAAVLLLLACAGAVLHLLVEVLAGRRCDRSTVAVIAALIAGVAFDSVLVAERLPLRFRYAVVMVGVPLLVAAAWLWWRGGHRPGWARAVVVATGVAYLALATGPIKLALARAQLRPAIAAIEELRAPIPSASSPRSRPDIYLLLIDTYPGADVLSAVYGYDNGAFRDSLRAMGFRMHHARANYTGTAWALASMLNATYLDPLAPVLDSRTREIWPLYDLIHDDRVSAFLEERGYRTYIVPTVGWIGTSVHERARVHLTTPTIGAVEGTWLRGRLLYHLWPHTLVGKLLPALARWSSRESVLSGFDGVSQLLGSAGPKMVLLHSMAAHFPFSVDGKCASLPREVPGPEAINGAARDAYVAGIRCSDRRVLALLREILARSGEPPVILIQGDHGPRGLGIPWTGDPSAISPAQGAERLSVLGAYLLPGAPTLLPDSVTPVNVVRSVLRYYLGADLPPLPDRSYHVMLDRPFRFIELPHATMTQPASSARTSPDARGIRP